MFEVKWGNPKFERGGAKRKNLQEIKFWSGGGGPKPRLATPLRNIHRIIKRFGSDTTGALNPKYSNFEKGDEAYDSFFSLFEMVLIF